MMMINKLFRANVIPAKAGIQEAANWTPAFAGVTSYLVYFVELHNPTCPVHGAQFCRPAIYTCTCGVSAGVAGRAGGQAGASF
jgi:hypothetical protein